MTLRRGSLGALDIAALLAAPGLALAFILADLFAFHPGYSAVDESRNVLYAQLALEGSPLSWISATGSVTRLLQWLATRCLGPSLAALHSPALFAFCLENLLLWSLARRLFGRRAAYAALLFNLACAFSLLRGRSLLSYALLPCELLLALHLLWMRGRGAALAAGLLGGLFFFDYEAWAVGMAVLGLLAFIGPRRGRGWAAGAGLALGAGIVLWVSREHLMGWYLMRRSYSGGADLGGRGAEWLLNLRAFFLGGDSIAYLGPDGHSAVPRWSLPFLALGLWGARKKTWLLAWLALGLAPLMATSYGSEPNRAICAWPALALLAALGFRQLRALGRKPAWALLLAAAALGSADELRAYQASMDRNAAAAYGRSRTLMQAAKNLREISARGGLELLTDFEFERGPELRFLAGPLDPGPRCLAWIPEPWLPALSLEKGSWLTVQNEPSVAPEYFLEPAPALALRLRAIDREIRGLEAALPQHEQRKAAAQTFAWLDSHPGADIWVRSALWAREMNYAGSSGDISQARMDQLLAEPLNSAAPLYQPGILMLHSHPIWARQMLLKGQKIDPRKKLDAETMQRIQALAEAEKNR